jgi:alpha-D-xyloside xylohydrolase
LEFDRERFPDPGAWFKQMAELGIKISLWQLPYIPEGSALFNELKAVDGFVKNKDGTIYDCHICFTPGFKGVVGVVDYTNPAAVRVHQEHFRRLFELGAKVIKADFGEEAPAEGVYHDGTPGHRMHNLYPLLYNKALFEVTKECTGDGVIWARSAWAGSQRYPLHWGGDNSPNFDNLIPQLEGGLSFGLSGFSFWSQDIGGFLGETGGDLLVRWMQVGMFCSHSRIHGFGNRELYKFDEKTFRLCREFIRLRYRLMPYILGSAQRCVEQSLPLMRALVIEFQDDPTVWNIGDQYMFGDFLMVCPVFTADGRRRIYFPVLRDASGHEGMWTDWWTGNAYKGGRWMDWEAPIETMPLFLRDGAIVPMGPLMNFIGEKPLTEIEIVVTPHAADGKSSACVQANGKSLNVTLETLNGEMSVGIPADTNIRWESHTPAGKSVTVKEQ